MICWRPCQSMVPSLSDHIRQNALMHLGSHDKEAHTLNPLSG